MTRITSFGVAGSPGQPPILVERLVLGVDVEGFSRLITRRQQVVQQRLDLMLDAAAQASGLSRTEWDRRAEGDGETAVLPGDVDLLVVLRTLVERLDDLLVSDRSDSSPDLTIRLRVAMVLDVLTPGMLGYAGPALITLNRLLNADPVRGALRDHPTANLALVISDRLYDRAVRNELGGLRPDQFAELRIDLPRKNFHETAYLRIPGNHARARARVTPDPIDLRHLHGVNGHQPRRPPEIPAAPPTPEPVPEPPSRAVLDLVADMQHALAAGEVAAADELTTRALLEHTGRTRAGWLRIDDGALLPLDLLASIDAAWSAASSGAWGLRAQRARCADLAVTSPRQFRALCVLLGWRANPDDPVPPYPAFTGGAPDGPFYPTLRNPDREHHERWHDDWAKTVIAVHKRLIDCALRAPSRW